MERGIPKISDEGSVRWDENSACRDADREQFYVSKVGRSDGDPLGLREKFCNHCTVVATCLAEAIERKDVSATIVGGTTREERKRLIRANLEAKGVPIRRNRPSIDPERIRAFWLRALEQ